MSISYHAIQAFLYREARLLDDRQWDEWLECYRQDAEFWMPAWDDDDQLTRDPQSEISLIYYPNRDGLEDRVYRIKTERSGASTPEPRTTHQVTNLEVLKEEGDTVELRFNWHTLSHRYKKTDSYFGSAFYTLDVSGETPLITRKVVQLNNDYIHQVIDVYHV
ncbi:benzoate 1,2-dioxygenase small subunit [Halomonas aestuarii]|uniref:Benzoate 1,2-dioxygenase small subunit n=1 Tax=Halomonas aestuarii TaxID=1897729 RepID=A0A1J0VET3_9GAMM|nr:benzoate 1,2-dioxygenase small subunit [Halomonas aestuarii]APE30513.1 benzoate 1,2-dioxygenase small subunit [Halomonas aestuarii]APE30517.1 benzoate 1,2-dioxygenase small subunit [Halomonas aestuarii]